MSRLCTVSFRDHRGMTHEVEVSAASLFEAAALGLKAFRESEFGGRLSPGANAEMSVRVTLQAEEHRVRVRQIETWLEGNGRTPREQALKARFRGEG